MRFPAVSLLCVGFICRGTGEGYSAGRRFFVCVGEGLRGGSLRASARVRVFNFNYELRLGVLWGNGVILWRGGGEGAAAPCDPCPTLYK